MDFSDLLKAIRNGSEKKEKKNGMIFEEVMALKVGDILLMDEDDDPRLLCVVKRSMVSGRLGFIGFAPNPHGTATDPDFCINYHNVTFSGMAKEDIKKVSPIIFEKYPKSVNYVREVMESFVDLFGGSDDNK